MPAVVAESSLIQLDRSLHMSMNADAVPPSHSLPPDEYRIGAQQQGMGGRPAYGGERMQYSDAGHEASQVNHIGGHGVWQQSHLPGLISGPSPTATATRHGDDQMSTAAAAASAAGQLPQGPMHAS
eukprot:TRINITY_DN13244_c0_g1_i1.p1 TRINITY_DN13244_c0_g1~~TRINITY_DN13244_c0_g1_i1.p1  ORF type:complete len:126 (+),score=10.24 TRINITY_DN13244_c0_g1_i1:233-610(+)